MSELNLNQRVRIERVTRRIPISRVYPVKPPRDRASIIGIWLVVVVLILLAAAGAAAIAGWTP